MEKEKLDTKRMDHSCGLSYKKDGTKVVVVAGGSQMTGPNTFKTLDSVEILQWINEELQEWKQGIKDFMNIKNNKSNVCISISIRSIITHTIKICFNGNSLKQ